MPTSYLDDFGDDAFDEITKQGVKTGENDFIPRLADHPHFQPVFGLDYISLDQGSFSFNNPEIPTRDFIELLRSCQKISKLTYDELGNVLAGNAYHFHEVDRHRLVQHGLVEEFKMKLPGRTRDIPPVYQFALYTSSSVAAPRVLGYIGKWGIFYLLWFDWGHRLYPRPNSAAPVVAPQLAAPLTTLGLRADGRPKRQRLPAPPK